MAAEEFRSAFLEGDHALQLMLGVTGELDLSNPKHNFVFFFLEELEKIQVLL